MAKTRKASSKRLKLVAITNVKVFEDDDTTEIPPGSDGCHSVVASRGLKLTGDRTNRTIQLTARLIEDPDAQEPVIQLGTVSYPTNTTWEAKWDTIPELNEMQAQIEEKPPNDALVTKCIHGIASPQAKKAVMTNCSDTILVVYPRPEIPHRGQTFVSAIVAPPNLLPLIGEMFLSKDGGTTWDDPLNPVKQFTTPILTVFLFNLPGGEGFNAGALRLRSKPYQTCVKTVIYSLEL